MTSRVGHQSSSASEAPNPMQKFMRPEEDVLKDLARARHTTEVKALFRELYDSIYLTPVTSNALQQYRVKAVQAVQARRESGLCTLVFTLASSLLCVLC